MNQLFSHTPGAPFSEDEKRFVTETEWLVTNGLGGYATGTVGGTPSRVFHGYLVAALPSPKGRTMLLNQVLETVVLPDGRTIPLNGLHSEGSTFAASNRLHRFQLDHGMPVWTFEVEGLLIEKRVYLPHRQNTAYLRYAITGGSGQVQLQLRPAINFRGHEEPVNTPLQPYSVSFESERFEIRKDHGGDLVVRLVHSGEDRHFSIESRTYRNVRYDVERDRGYIWQGDLWSPGYFCARLSPDSNVALIASTEDWEVLSALSPDEAWDAERDRKRRLLLEAHPDFCPATCRDLVWAADQFIFAPVGRREDTARARAAGDEIRSVIAGYHWFTDWGRDTMISLEGLTLATGRQAEASYIIRTFAHYIQDGLIPNMFPEGETDGLYHTADATLWFFHAVHRYMQLTNDRHLLQQLLPKLLDIVGHHLRGTHFGIHVDPNDGLLSQGKEGYQLTWMDAKVDGWVVTPRRGKAVEINALWYNALCLLENWLREADRTAEADGVAAHAQKAMLSFNQRFWNPAANFLFDVVDGEDGSSDPVCRPNQLFAISLDHPVLDASRWQAVLQVARERLLTPVGLRSLAPGEPNYRARYDGDLRSRDAAYHQGTVWGWLIGTFIDAWLRVYPDDMDTARGFLAGFVDHLSSACAGSISEVFDAEPPYKPRGCCAQAWSVAEVLRCFLKTSRAADVRPPAEPLLTAVS